MTDKKQIIIDGVDISECKYKFQNKEKFNGKPYCLCFNELCEDLSFVCDHNCQIYEDCKQLARKTAECEKLKEYIEANKATGICETCTHKALLENDRYRKALKEIEKILKDEICEECPGKEGCKAGCKEHQCLNIINEAKGR